MSLDGISFDEQDANLFQVPDATLRANALRNSILPRLHVVVQEAIALIRQIYGVEVLEDSGLCYSPHFRTIRKSPKIEMMYEWATYGFTGKRDTKKWTGFIRSDGKPIKCSPYYMDFSIRTDGMTLGLLNGTLQCLSADSYRKMFSIYHKYDDEIAALLFYTKMWPSVYFDPKECKPLSPMKKVYQWMEEKRLYDVNLFSRTFRFPVTSKELVSLIHKCAFLFPLYDSFVQIAQDRPERFLSLVDRANDWIIADYEKQEAAASSAHEEKSAEQSTESAIALAEQRTRVMPAMRWQVFQRDGWKCCACGRGSKHDVILHVDHILPRSKGGEDVLGNFQTLCWECNIGKSNRDATNLRLLI